MTDGDLVSILFQAFQHSSFTH